MGVYGLVPSSGCHEPCVMDAWKSLGEPQFPRAMLRECPPWYFFFHVVREMDLMVWDQKKESDSWTALCGAESLA